MQGSPSDSEGLEEILQSTSLSGRHGSTHDCPNDHDQVSGLARHHGNDDFSDDRRLPFGGFDSFINPMAGRPTTSSEGAGVGHARMRMVLFVSPMGPNENQHRPMQGIDSYQRSSPRPSDEYEASRRLPVSSLLRGGTGLGELGLAFPFSRGGQQAMFPVSPDDDFAGSSHGNLHTTGGPTITEIDDSVHDHHWQYPNRTLSTGPKITELLDNDSSRASNSKHGQPNVTGHAPTKRRNKNATVIRNFPVHPEITSASNSTPVSSLDSFTSSTEHSSLNDNGTARRKHVSREKDKVDHKLPNYQDKNPGLTDLNGKSDANMLPSSQGDIHRPTVHYHVNIDDIPTDSDSETGVSDSGDDYSVDDNYDLNSLFDMELASIGNPDNEIEALNAEMKSDESNNLKHNEEHTQGMESSVKRADKYPKTTEGAEFIKPTNDNNNLDKVPTTQDSIREDHVATLHTESSSRESTETTRIANAATTVCSTEIGKVTNTPSDDDVKQPQPRQDVHRSHRPHRKSTSSCQHHHTHTIHHCQNGILVHCVGCWLQWHTVCTCASPKGKRCKDKNKNMGRSQTDDSIREFTSPGASRSPHNANVGVSFDDLLHTVGLSVKEVHPDGNCLFSAVVDQLRVIGQFRHTARSLRTATVDYLERNPYQEDGTHLSAFIDHHSGDTWQQYLTNLRNEGHWGDQITVCALANVLRRRIVIYKHLGTHLDRTEVSPMAANASALDTEGRSDKSPTADTTTGLQGGLVDDDIELCLGHVDDAHYVSLRKLDWKESLNQDSNEGVTIVKDRPINVDVWYSEIEVDFVFNFVRRQRFLCHCPYKDTGCTAYQSPTVQELVCNFDSSLEFSWDIGYSRRHVTPESERHVQFTFPIDSRARLPKEDSISKDVVVNTEGCPMGHLCLEPVMPSLWQHECMAMNGKSHLKHSNFNIDVGSEESRPPAPLTGFLCTWPVEACEWIARTRPSGWPSVTDIEHVVANGCHVQPALGYAVNLWEFSFLRSDHMLYTRCMTLAMKSYFFIVVALLESTFQEGVLLGNAHWRTLFFYMLEVTTNSQIKKRPYKCLLIMLDRLEWCLKTNMFPDYYIQSKNMFGSFDIDNGTLCWYLQRLTYLREAPVQTLLCVIDDGECAEEHTLLKVLDDITELNTASQEGMSDSEYARSLMAICTHGIKRWIDYKQFSRALHMIRTLLVQWTSRFDLLDVNGDDLIEQTMYRLTLEQQCVFAFLIDTTDGTSWMERFRSRCACVPLLNILGSDAPSLPEVPNITWSDIWIPEHVLYGNLAAFMKEFTLVLYRDLDQAAASILILHKFLKCNTHDIILGVTTETESAILAKSMHLSSLYHLYVFMYHLLYERSEIDTFSELMGLFDETCNCLGFPYNLRFIAKLWSHFGHQDRAEDAIMKADVIEIDLKMRESRLLESMQTDVPVMHMSFAMKFILRSDVLYEPLKLQSEMIGVMFTVEQYGATDPLNAELIDIHRVSNTVLKPIALVVASDTVVRYPDTSQNVGLKDLWACCDGSKVGLTRLRPVDPVRWLPKVSPNGDLKAIGHIEIGQLAFNCEWPSICEEWLTRPRRFNWPPQDVKERIRQAGIRVVQSQATNDAQCEEGCEYEYTFMAAEAILCDSCVSPGQRDCFRIVKMVLDMMKVTRLITMAMMKHTFFYLCEEIEPSLWTSRLAQYAIMFIGKLSNNLTAGQFPNYFVNKLNMFQSQDVDNNVEIVLEDLAFARNNLFVCLYFALDFYVNISYPLARIFDRIVEDVQAYNVDHDDVSAIQRCFVPCVIDSILDSISNDKFTNAYECLQTAVSELNSLNEQPHARVALDQLIMQVLQRCPKTGKRWLFAFYVDIVQNTQYTEAVTTDNEPGCPFADAYGHTLEDHLAAAGASRRQIRLPESMITAENYVLLTLGILSIFQSLDIPDEVVMGTVKHFVKLSVPKIDAFIKDPREPIQAKHHIIQMVPLMLKIVESQMESRVLQKTINTLQGIMKQRNTR